MEGMVCLRVNGSFKNCFSIIINVDNRGFGVLGFWGFGVSSMR